jgi:neutral ceramidase
MKMLSTLLILLCSSISTLCYKIGTGISDITGPSVQVMLMGYALLGQNGEGILQRLWSRAYIIVDEETDSRIVFVNTDTQSMGDIIKKRVVDALQDKYGPHLYTVENVMISSTHSHSGMGGYLQYSKAIQL